MATDTGIAAGIVAMRRRLHDGIATVFAPLVSWLARRGVLPDQISWAGFDLAVAAAVLAGLRFFTFAGILFLLSGIADLIDGSLARRAERSTAGGAFLDSLLDRTGEGLLHAGAAVAFALWGMWPGVLAIVLSLTGSYLTSYARARAEGLGITLEEAWVSRGERVVLISLGLIFHIALLAFWVVAAASWATVVQRALVARRRLHGSAETDVSGGGEAADEAAPPDDGPAGD